MFECMILLSCGVAVVLYVINKWLKVHEKYFEKRGVPHLKPTSFIGIIRTIVYSRENMPELIQKLYANFPTKKFVVKSFQYRTIITFTIILDILACFNFVNHSIL